MTEPLNVGRLFRMKLEWSAHVRNEALKSIRELPNERWTVRIGGPHRGVRQVFRSREDAVAAVQAHYNAKLREYTLALARRKQAHDDAAAL